MVKDNITANTNRNNIVEQKWGEVRILSIVADRTFKFVKYAIVLVQIAEFGTEMIVDMNGFDGFGFHSNIPYLQRHVIAGQYESSVSAEFDIADGRDNLREEGFGAGIFYFLKY